MDDWSINGQEDVFAEGSRTVDQIMDSLAGGLDGFSATNFLERDIGQGMQVLERFSLHVCD